MTAPQWHPRPTEPGWWLIRNLVTSETRLHLYRKGNISTLEGWHDWRAYGPIEEPPRPETEAKESK